MPKESSDLKAKLKKADTQVKDYISELEARNAKRQRAIVKLEADKIERDNRIKALQEEIHYPLRFARDQARTYCRPQPHFQRSMRAQTHSTAGRSQHGVTRRE